MPRRRKFSFDDLIFAPTGRKNETQATLTFLNSYGCNVFHHSPNTNTELPYEFELLLNGEHVARMEVCDDNVGYCSKDDICELISQAQRL